MMISDKIKQFFENLEFAFVASADGAGNPHLSSGREIEVPDPEHLVFKNWFCPTTLANVQVNPRLSVTLVDPCSGVGYQLTGAVEEWFDTAILDGYAPDIEEPGTPQVQYRFTVRVEGIMEFSPGRHTDHPL